MNSRIKENVSKLFEYWCEISPAKPDDKVPGYIVESFPESFKDSKVIADIPSFAFPCELFERKTIQVHSFVLTNIDSKWRFGFCRHDPNSSKAMVIITYLPWHDTFIRFLNVLAEIKKNPYNEFQPFLAEAYNKGVPEPGAYLKLYHDRATQTFLFQRPSQFQLPSIPENHNLNLYYNFVEPKFMIGVFAAMLAERRIIFVSRRLDILSSCIQAANSFLYPMVWQHIFIPVLPMKMKDILGAPMPFLIGVPEAVYETLKRDEIGDVVILNCDKRILETPFEDVKNMPQDLVASLKKQLSNPAEHRGDRVSKIFLGILVQLIGGYRDAVKFNNKITFDPDTFIESRPAPLRPFLTNMLQLQIFQQFIEERLDMLNTGQGFSDEFELENFRYAEKTGKKAKLLLNKDFFRNVKDKTNPAVKSAVKSVKEGGRGMKTAYKGFRSKFRETTPPKSKLDSHSHVPQYDMGHQSAPNSPVFNKRPQTIALADDTYRNHNHALTPSSTSLYNSPHIMMSNNNNIYNNDVRSPTLSPTSSNSSSEMNLLQELQQFALFKSPAINRSLKPTNSFDLHNRTSRTGAPLNPPPSCQSLPKIQEVSHFQQISSIDKTDKSSTSTSRIHSPTSASNNNIYTENDVCFDTSPDMPSPPVPPRRMQSAALALAAIQISPPPLSPPSSCSSNSSCSKYNNFVHIPNQNPNCDLFSLTPNNIVDKTHQRPLPLAPKPLRKESNVDAAGTNIATADQSKDLINLEANSSFEIEDFDPLNDNAKPIPHVPSFTKSATSSPPPILSFNNPIHPYFTPQHHINHGAPHKKEAQDDIELLRNYGLDKFTIQDGPNGERKSLNTNSYSNIVNNVNIFSPEASSSSSSTRNSNTSKGHTWTTFD